MPISQKTILSIYGDLLILVTGIENLRELYLQPDLLIEPPEREIVFGTALAALADRARDASKAALETIMEEAPDLSVNPLTGAIDE